MGAAIGRFRDENNNGGGGGSTPSSSGYFVVDIDDFGASPTAGFNNSPAIQAAVDHAKTLLANHPLQKAIVKIKSTNYPYECIHPIFVDYPRIGIEGEGLGSYVKCNFYNQPFFIFGVRRIEYDANNNITYQITSNYRPDLYNKLDSSAVSSPNTRWGFRTFGNSFLQFQGCSFSCGQKSPNYGYPFFDNWEELSKFTLEMCFEPGTGSDFPRNGPILSLGSLIYETSPILIYRPDTENPYITVKFRTKDMREGKFGPYRSFAIDLNGASKPYRLTLQFDLTVPEVLVYLNGQQKSLIGSSNMDGSGDYPFVPTTFGQNRHYPLLIGSEGLHGLSGPYTPQQIDLALYGLAFYKDKRYRNLGVGQSQLRIDDITAEINDNYRYFTNNSSTITYLACQDNPSTAGRLITTVDGSTGSFGSASRGLFMSSYTSGGIAGNSIKNLLIEMSGGGIAVAIGSCLDFEAYNLDIRSGYYAIGAWCGIATYTVNVRSCYLGSSDSQIFGMNWLGKSEDIKFEGSGRVTIRMVASSWTHEDGLIAQPSLPSESILSVSNGGYGSQVVMKRVLVDYEGATMNRPAIYAENYEVVATNFLLRLEDIQLGTTGGQPMVYLTDHVFPGNPNFSHAVFIGDNIQTADREYDQFIKVDGSQWEGKLINCSPVRTRIYNTQLFDTYSSIIVEELWPYVCLPTDWYWLANAHLLNVNRANSSQYKNWICIQSGEYGTNNPPEWAGSNIINGAQGIIASYIHENIYITANLT